MASLPPIKITRYPADQEGPYGPGVGNRDRFSHTLVGPDVGMVEGPSSAWVPNMLFSCVASGGASAPDGTPLLLPVMIAGNPENTRHYFRGVGPIGTVNQMHQAVGALSLDVPTVNRWVPTFEYYLESRSEQNASSIFNGSISSCLGLNAGGGLPNVPGFLYSRPIAMDTAVTQANNPTQIVPTEYRVPLHYIDVLGRLQNYPMFAMPSIKYEVVLERLINTATNCVMPKAISCQDATSPAAGSIGSAAAPLLLTQTFPSVQSFSNIPLYVGAPLFATYTVGANPPASLGYTIVSSLKVDSGTGNLEVVLDPTITVAAGSNVTAITLNYYGDANPGFPLEAVSGHTCSYQIIESNIELVRLMLTDEALAKSLEALQTRGLEFLKPNVMTITQDPGPQFDWTYPSPPGAVACALFTPQSGNLISGTDHVGYYSTRINGNSNSDLYVFAVGPEYDNNSTVSIGRQMHNDRLITFYRNLGLYLRRFDNAVGDAAATLLPGGGVIDPFYQYYDDFFFLPQILDRLGGDADNTITLYSDGTDMKQKTVYQVYWSSHVITVKNGRLVITPVSGLIS